jgi:ribonuclease J
MGLKDFFEFDMIPRIKGVYSKKALKHTDFAYADPLYDAILISHIHSDHFGDVQWVDEKIPVYMGSGAKELNDTYNEVYPYNFRRLDNGNVKSFATGDKIKIKDIEITPIHVDHSTPAAYGFIIKTPEGTLAYSGDFRMHGYMPEMTNDFIKAAAKAKPDILMTEGTRVKMDKKEEDPFKKKLTEQQVLEMMYKAIKTADGITLADFSVRNIDRLRSLYAATKKAGKTLLISTRAAHIISNVRHLFKDFLPIPLESKDIKIFKKNAGYDKAAAPDHWERPYLENAVDYKWVAKNSGDIVFFITESDMMQLIDIKPKGGTFIYSMSDHYLEGEDFKKKKVCFDNWMKHFNLKFEQIHCSGHAFDEDVQRLIKEINPGKVLPMHTHAPEAFKGYHGNVILMERGKSVKI